MYIIMIPDSGLETDEYWKKSKRSDGKLQNFSFLGKTLMFINRSNGWPIVFTMRNNTLHQKKVAFYINKFIWSPDIRRINVKTHSAPSLCSTNQKLMFGYLINNCRVWSSLYTALKICLMTTEMMMEWKYFKHFFLLQAVF